MCVDTKRFDLCIRNGTVITSNDTFKADVGISRGKVTQIGKVQRAKRDIDASGLYVMPGAIDTHTHLDMPSGDIFTTDDFESGTIAAVAGGVTTLIDFAVQLEGMSLTDTLAVWKAKAAEKAIIDYSFHLAITKWDDSFREEIGLLVQEGVTSFKAFMAYKGSLMLDDAALFLLLQAAQEHQAMVLIHAESGDAIHVLQGQALARGDRSPEFHALTRPPLLEGEATSRAIAFAKITGTALFIVHVSCEAALEPIRAAQERGFPIFAETCPQYLGAISNKEYSRPGFEGAKFVCSPPLRDEKEAQALWAGIRRGNLQTIGSDHCPFSMDQKRLGEHDFTRIPNGIPGIETRVPLTWTLGVGRGFITPNQFVDLIATKPARLFGLPHKGDLKVGFDADIMVFDPELEVTITNERLHQQSDYTPYEGFRCRGYPVFTISRGECVWENGTSTAKPGRGQWQRRVAGNYGAS